MRPVVFLAAFWFGLYATFEPGLSNQHEGAFLAPPPKALPDPHNAKSYGPLTVWRCGIPDVCVHARHRSAP